jgi:hypothetical protein
MDPIIEVWLAKMATALPLSNGRYTLVLSAPVTILAAAGGLDAVWLQANPPRNRNNNRSLDLRIGVSVFQNRLARFHLL